MKALIQEIYARPAFGRIVEWGKLVSITGFSQIIIQGLGLIGGILVIRLLPTQEYGLYTLANTMLGTMLVLADGGILNSVMAQGGKVWSNPDKLGVVAATGFKLRKKFATVSLLVIVPILIFLLRRHDAGWLTSAILVGSLVPAFLSALSGNLLSVGPLLHQSIGPLQKIQIAVSLRKLIMQVVFLFIFPWAFIAVLCAGLPQIWGNFRLIKLSARYVSLNQKPDPDIQSEILSVVKRILPGSIYYCLSGQITIWIISYVGNTAAVAQIGALGRLSMVLAIFSTLFGTLVLPRFARLGNCRNLLFKRFFQVVVLLLALFSGVISIATIFPSQLLWILGKNYAGLEKELILNIIGSCLSVLCGLLFAISSSRNWAINPIISIPFTIAAIGCSSILIDLSTLSGVLKFNISVAALEVMLYFTYNIMQIYKVE
ncbi:MAG: polysaccharide biosynthesis protein [Pedobacter sp.]|jgi:O-antigen/teichoic acid export membrane protein|nr:polysaccharide biosynthesis protein [Pedobacter sp.]